MRMILMLTFVELLLYWLSTTPSLHSWRHRLCAFLHMRCKTRVQTPHPPYPKHVPHQYFKTRWNKGLNIPWADQVSVCLWIILVPFLFHCGELIGRISQLSNLFNCHFCCSFTEWFFLWTITLNLYNLELILFNACTSCLHLSEDINYAILKYSCFLC